MLITRVVPEAFIRWPCEMLGVPDWISLHTRQFARMHPSLYGWQIFCLPDCFNMTVSVRQPVISLARQCTSKAHYLEALRDGLCTPCVPGRFKATDLAVCGLLFRYVCWESWRGSVYRLQLWQRTRMQPLLIAKIVSQACSRMAPNRYLLTHAKLVKRVSLLNSSWWEPNMRRLSAAFERRPVPLSFMMNLALIDCPLDTYNPFPGLVPSAILVYLQIPWGRPNVAAASWDF